MPSPTSTPSLPHQGANQITAERLAAHLSALQMDVAAITEYAHGVAAQNFHVTRTDGRELVARCDRRRPIASAREDRLFSVLVRRSGLAAPVGPWSFSTMDGITVILRPRLEGMALPDLPLASWPDGRHLGSLLARIHGMARPPTARRFFYAAAYAASETQRQEFHQAPTRLSDIPAAAALVQYALARTDGIATSRALMDLAPLTVIHGDYTPPNFLLDGSQLHILDWEKACLGPSYSDIAQAIYYFGAANPRSATVFASSFLAGYRTHSSFSPASLRAWIYHHPAMIFLVDAVSAARNRALPAADFSEKRERYFREVCVPRFEQFLDVEDDVLRLMAEACSLPQ